MKSSSKRLVLIAAVAASALFLAGCEFSCSVGGGNSVSSEELNTQVKDSYESDTGVKLNSIDCQEVDAEVGKPIICEATNENEIDLNITGTVTDYNSDTEKIKFNWQVVSAMAPGVFYAKAAQRTLADQRGVQLTNFECPDRVPLKKGSKFDCTAEDPDGNARTVTIDLTDGDGGFNVNLQRLGS